MTKIGENQMCQSKAEFYSLMSDLELSKAFKITSKHYLTFSKSVVAMAQ
jgi:hypothetical protein